MSTQSDVHLLNSRIEPEGAAGTKGSLHRWNSKCFGTSYSPSRSVCRCEHSCHCWYATLWSPLGRFSFLLHPHQFPPLSQSHTTSCFTPSTPSTSLCQLRWCDFLFTNWHIMLYHEALHHKFNHYCILYVYCCVLCHSNLPTDLKFNLAAIISLMFLLLSLLITYHSN